MNFMYVINHIISPIVSVLAVIFVIMCDIYHIKGKEKFGSKAQMIIANICAVGIIILSILSDI